MEIKFENATTDKSINADVTESFKIKFDCDGGLYFTLTNDYFGHHDKKYAFYSMSKNQLSDFIGALLHVQQKLNKKR